MSGVPTTEELWELFWKYEQRASDSFGASQYGIMAATMANAIARILVSREETSTYNMFRNRTKPT